MMARVMGVMQGGTRVTANARDKSAGSRWGLWEDLSEEVDLRELLKPERR